MTYEIFLSQCQLQLKEVFTGVLTLADVIPLLNLDHDYRLGIGRRALLLYPFDRVPEKFITSFHTGFTFELIAISVLAAPAGNGNVWILLDIFPGLNH